MNIKNTNSMELGVLAIVLLFQLIGWVGLSFTPYSETMARLTPLNLLLTCGLMLYFARPIKRSLVIFSLICFTIGMGVELLGVHTGQIFGEYSYTNILGPSLAGVPFIIGVNWFLLIYSIACFVAF